MVRMRPVSGGVSERRPGAMVSGDCCGLMAQRQHGAEGWDYEKASNTWNPYGSLLWDPCPKAINMDSGQFIHWVCGTRTPSIKFPNINVLHQGGVPGQQQQQPDPGAW